MVWLNCSVRDLYKYTQVYSNGEPMLFEDDVFKAEIPLSDMSTADNRR